MHGQSSLVGYRSVVSQRVGHDQAHSHTHTHGIQNSFGHQAKIVKTVGGRDMMRKRRLV